MKIRNALVAVTAAAAIFALAGCTPAGGGTTTEVDSDVAAEIDAVNEVPASGIRLFSSR